MPDLPTIGGGPSVVASDPTGSIGISVAAGGSANTKGAWTELIASTDVDGAWLLMTITGGNSSRAYLFDIGIGAASSEVVLLPNLYFELIANGAANFDAWLIPVAIPRGSRVSVRCQSTTASALMFIGLNVISSPIDSPPALRAMEACGVVTGSTTLTPIDPGGTANTDSAWVELIAATGFSYRWMAVCFGHGLAVMSVACQYLVDIGIGGSGSEVAIINDIYVRSATTADLAMPKALQFPVAIPAGSRISARVRCSSNSDGDRDIQVAVWGVG